MNFHDEDGYSPVEWDEEFEAKMRAVTDAVLGPVEHPAAPPRTSRTARKTQHERANARIVGRLSPTERVHRYCAQAAKHTMLGRAAYSELDNCRQCPLSQRIAKNVDRSEHEMRGAPDPVWWQEALEDLADGIGEQLPPDIYCKSQPIDMDSLEGCHATPTEVIADLDRQWKSNSGPRLTTARQDRRS